MSASSGAGLPFLPGPAFHPGRRAQHLASRNRHSSHRDRHAEPPRSGYMTLVPARLRRTANGGSAGTRIGTEQPVGHGSPPIRKWRSERADRVRTGLRVADHGKRPLRSTLAGSEHAGSPTMRCQWMTSSPRARAQNGQFWRRLPRAAFCRIRVSSIGCGASGHVLGLCREPGTALAQQPRGRSGEDCQGDQVPDPARFSFPAWAMAGLIRGGGWPLLPGGGLIMPAIVAAC